VSIVLDASVVARWFLTDELSARSDELLERVLAEGAYAPALFRWEIQNVLLQAERAHRMTSEDVDAAMDSLRDLPITLEDAGMRFFAGPEIRLARHYELTTYDAAYLALAAGRNIALATLDHALAQAAHDLGITVLS
jgi:predicted nucleic acid-binding protein